MAFLCVFLGCFKLVLAICLGRFMIMKLEHMVFCIETGENLPCINLVKYEFC